MGPGGVTYYRMYVTYGTHTQHCSTPYIMQETSYDMKIRAGVVCQAEKYGSKRYYYANGSLATVVFVGRLQLWETVLLFPRQETGAWQK